MNPEVDALYEEIDELKKENAELKKENAKIRMAIDNYYGFWNKED